MLDLGQVFLDELAAKGCSIDEAEYAATRALAEIFPSESTDLLDAWERVFAVTPEADATIDQRRATVAAKFMAVGGITTAYFEGIATTLGYAIGAAGTTDPHIRIVDSAFPPFRAGYSVAGDPVYDGGTGASQFTIMVYGTAVETDSRLQTIFNDLKPAWTEIIYTNE